VRIRSSLFLAWMVAGAAPAAPAACGAFFQGSKSWRGGVLELQSSVMSHEGD